MTTITTVAVSSRPTHTDFRTDIATATAKATEGRENDPGDISVRALEQATHGYQSWMGSVESFQEGYRDGYRRGFRRGYEATNRRWRDRDYDDYRY